MAFFVHRVPAAGGSAEVEELSRFLRAHRVLTAERRRVESPQGASWAFCVEYLEGPAGSADRPVGKVDYREVLPPEPFVRFSRMPAVR